MLMLILKNNVRNIVVLLTILTSFCLSDTNIHGGIGNGANVGGDYKPTVNINETNNKIINQVSSTPLDLKLKLGWILPMDLMKLSGELEWNNMLFTEVGIGYSYGNKDYKREYTVLLEEKEIPDDRLFGFAGAGIRYYNDNGIFVEGFLGVAKRANVDRFSPHISASIGLYQYDGKVKNGEISLGVLYYDEGLQKIKFNEFGETTYDKINREVKFIVSLKILFQSQINRRVR